jgi:hypothetical protein
VRDPLPPAGVGRDVGEVIEALQMEAEVLFAATLLLVVFFLIARVVNARQPIALAFALMPLLLTFAARGVMSFAAAGLF